jgi:16S rRNA (guanine(966)-N(2))-methyltransferase RsmD
MRVIAGTHRSRILKTLKGLAMRPTSDRLRETLFNVLGPGVSGSRFLDVFAGTGAVGIEALSRGAAHAAFIENHAPSIALIHKNLASLKISSNATVLCADALRGLETLEAKLKSGGHQYDYVFIDPPYAATGDYSRVLKYLASSSLLVPSAIVIVEHRKSFNLAESFGVLQRVRLLRQGDSALAFYRRHDAAQNPTSPADNP